MRKLFSAISIFCLTAMISITLSAQDQELNQTVKERVYKLENICGIWTGMTGDVTVTMSMDMEDSSSAIGELTKEDMVYFLHCFTDDMDKLDPYAAGPGKEYEYCILQQNSGETIGIFYLSLSENKLSGIYYADFIETPVTLTRADSSPAVMEINEIDLEKADEDKWENTRYLDTREAYESYLEDFPEGKYSGEAKYLLDTFEDRHLWEKTVEDGSFEAYKSYLDSPVQPKLNEIKAKGVLAYMNALNAENADDPDAVLKFLEEMEKTSGLTEDAEMMKKRNLEAQAYKKYLNSSDDEEAIRNGIEYVNTYLRGEHRSEVSDRVAYLMASSPAYLAGTPCEIMLTYAVTDSTKEYVRKQTSKAAKTRSRNSSKTSRMGFNGGIGGTVEATMPGYDMIYGGHALFSIGDNRNFFNFEFGIRYRYWQFKELTPEIGNVDFHHIRLVAAPKFNLIRQKKSAFYLYIAPEAGYGYPIDMHSTGLYMPNSISFGGRVGIGIGRFDLSAMATYDFIPMVNENFPAGRYSQQQVGVALTFYISGSGRN